LGQGSETNLPVPERSFSDLAKSEIRRRFDQVYERLYGRTYPDSPVEFINFKVRASLPARMLEFPKIERKVKSVQKAIKGKRQAYSAVAGGFIPFTVYDRYKLFPGAGFTGPAIIEERESTVIVSEEASVSLDDYGFVWIEMR